MFNRHVKYVKLKLNRQDCIQWGNQIHSSNTIECKGMHSLPFPWLFLSNFLTALKQIKNINFLFSPLENKDDGNDTKNILCYWANFVARHCSKFVCIFSFNLTTLLTRCYYYSSFLMKKLRIRESMKFKWHNDRDKTGDQVYLISKFLFLTQPWKMFSFSDSYEQEILKVISCCCSSKDSFTSNLLKKCTQNTSIKVWEKERKKRGIDVISGEFQSQPHYLGSS